ncbi:MAG: hypothetical protein LBI04_09735 [Treponema sp.]|nr:hypothetical protein [Treponema sp.]
MKKTAFVVLLVGLIFGNVFAQEEFNTPQKFSIMVDIFPAIEGAFEGNTGLGIFFETRINNYFSAVLEFNFYKNLSNSDMNTVVIGHGRIYPFKTTIGKAFYDLGIGYQRSKWETDDIHSLVGSLSAGWKFILGDVFVIEPNIGFWNNLVTFKGESSNPHAPIVGVNMGVAF